MKREMLLYCLKTTLANGSLLCLYSLLEPFFFSSTSSHSQSQSSVGGMGWVVQIKARAKQTFSYICVTKHVTTIITIISTLREYTYLFSLELLEFNQIIFLFLITQGTPRPNITLVKLT